MAILLLTLIPLVLAGIGGWLKARDVGALAAAVPIPALVVVLSIAGGLYLMNTEDGTDMRGAGGIMLIVIGAFVSSACLLVGWGMGRLRLKRDEQQS